MADNDMNGGDTNNGGESTANSLESDMAEVETMIRNARRALAGGDLLDMTPLGQRVAELCDKVRTMSLTSRDPEAVRLRLETMVLDLNRLEDEIRAGMPAPEDSADETGKKD